MKLSGGAVARYMRNPDLDHRGALIFGDDPALVAARRNQLCATLLGDDSPELRLTRLDPAMLRKDPAALYDALRETAFFGGRRVVMVTGATDGLAKVFSEALQDSAAEDAFLLVTAGSLPARSKLRALFDGAGHAVSAPCYADSAQQEDVSEALSELGLDLADADAAANLRAQRANLDFGAYQQMFSKLATYKLGDTTPVTAADVEACAPLPDDPEAHAIAAAVLSGSVDDVAALLSRAKPDASANSSLLMALSWQTKRLYGVLAAIEAGEPRDKALGRLRPPLFGDARAQVSRQLDRWTRASMESALRQIHEAQLSSRAAGAALPDAATARTLLRIAMMAARR